MNRILARLVVTPAHLFAFVAAAVLLLLAMVSAEAAPRLKPIVTITGDTVLLGDLIDGAGAVAARPVFGAPEPGQAGRISADRIVAAARDHGVTGIDTGGLTSIAVRRDGRRIGADEIVTAVVARMIADRLLPPDGTVELNAGRMELTVETAATGTIEIKRIDLAASGRFEALFTVAGSRALAVTPAQVIGSITDTVNVPVLSRPVLRGDALALSDIVLERRRRADLGQDAITDPARLAGTVARRALGRGAMLRESDLQRAEAVERNAIVMMVHEAPGMQLTMRGRALAAGAVGDVIQVQNVASRKIIEATVTAPGRVAVTGIVLPGRTAGTARQTSAN
jgi:flagella basal body P-ring formation protein FlgA